MPQPAGHCLRKAGPAPAPGDAPRSPTAGRAVPARPGAAAGQARRAAAPAGAAAPATPARAGPAGPAAQPAGALVVRVCPLRCCGPGWAAGECAPRQGSRPAAAPPLAARPACSTRQNARLAPRRLHSGACSLLRCCGRLGLIAWNHHIESLPTELSSLGSAASISAWIQPVCRAFPLAAQQLHDVCRLAPSTRSGMSTKVSSRDCSNWKFCVCAQVQSKLVRQVLQGHSLPQQDDQLLRRCHAGPSGKAELFSGLHATKFDAVPAHAECAVCSGECCALCSL